MFLVSGGINRTHAWYSEQEERVGIRASIKLEIIIQRDGWRVILIRYSFDSTFLERQLILSQLIHFLIAIFANSEGGNLPTMPFFDDFFDCVDGCCVDADCAREVHVTPIDELKVVR